MKKLYLIGFTEIAALACLAWLASGAVRIFLILCIVLISIFLLKLGGETNDK